MAVVLTVSASPAQAQSKFEIVTADGETAEITLSNNGKTLVLTAGDERFVWQRSDPKFDRKDGLAFVGTQDPKFVLWPKTGRGVMWAGDPATNKWVKLGTVTPVGAKRQPAARGPFPRVTLRSHQKAVVSLDIRPDGRYMLSGDASGIIRTWEMGPQPRHVANGAGQSGRKPAYRRGGDLAQLGFQMSGDKRVTKVVTFRVGANGRPTARRGTQDAPIQTKALAYSWDGTLLAAGGQARTGGRDGGERSQVRLWRDNGTNLTFIRNLNGDSGEIVHSVAFSPDGRLLITGGGGEDDEPLGRVRLWDVANARSEVAESFRGVVYSVAASNDPTASTAIAAYGGVRIQDAGKVWFASVIRGEETKSENLPGPVYAVALSRDGKGLAIGSGAGVLYMVEGTNEPTRLAVSAVVRSLAFSSDGSRLAAGCADGTIAVWAVRKVAVKQPTASKPITLNLTVRSETGELVADPKIEITGPGTYTKLRSAAGVHTYSLSKPGRYKVEVSTDGYGFETVFVDAPTRESGATVNRTVTVFPGFHLVLTVLETGTKRPVADPSIRIEGPGAHDKQGVSGGMHTYQLESKGQYQVTVSKPGFKEQVVGVSVEPGTARKTVLMSPAFDLSFWGVDIESGQRLSGLTVSFTGPGSSAQVQGKDNNYTFSFSSTGIYEVTISKPGYETLKRAISVEERPGQYSIPLHRSRHDFVVLVRDAGDAPVGAIKVEAPKGVAVSTPTSGSYALRLSPGVYEVKLRIAAEAAARPLQIVTIPAEEKTLVFKADSKALDSQSKRDRGRLDTNKDGRVTQEDSPMMWEKLKKLDANKNGDVELEEIESFVGVGRAPKKTRAPDRVKATPQSAQVRMDMNSDGRIDENDCDPETWKQVKKFQKPDGTIAPPAPPPETDPYRGREYRTELVRPDDQINESFADLLISVFDHNGNGTIDKIEVEENSWKATSQYDIAPRDEKLTRDEILQGMQASTKTPKKWKNTRTFFLSKRAVSKPKPTRGVLTIRKLGDG